MFIENERVRVEFGEPGVHPFLSIKTLTDGSWTPNVILGARQLDYFHTGSAFPRLFCFGEEVDPRPDMVMERAVDAPARVFLRDFRGGFEIESVVELPDGIPAVKVTHRLTAVRDVRLNRGFDRYDFVAAPGSPGKPGTDYSFVPHLRPQEDMVISDHVFRSPVVISARGDAFFAFVPDLEALSGAYMLSPARYYMDFLAGGGENHSPAVCFGIGRSRPVGHVYFRSDFGRPFALQKGTLLTIAYYILVGGGMDTSRVLSFMWERFGRRHLLSGLPQVMHFDSYAGAGLGRMFKKDDLFKRFKLDGRHCGGTVAMHNYTRRGVRLLDQRGLDAYLRNQDIALFVQRVGAQLLTEHPSLLRLFEQYVYRFGPRMPPQIMFQSWFNNFRSAYGAYWFARRWGDAELLESALAVKNLALSAPGERGVFPAVCYATEAGVSWSRGTEGFRHVDLYNTADCATTCYYMALWYRDHERDPRLLLRCREYALFLLDLQSPSGAIPAWVRPEEPVPVVAEALQESATTACGAMFLALLYLVGGDGEHLEAARRAADFLVREVIPLQKWFDYETFFSCSRKRPGMFDRFTFTYPQNTMSMYWAAEALRLLYLATGEERFLRAGREVLDHLLFYQQVWDPPFLSINAFGGFGVMNTDAEWNDSRQALFAPLLMDYYVVTGEPEHMERGIAALRASFTLMYIEENQKVAPGNRPAGREHERGSIAENYGHQGYDCRTPGYLESDWGAGSASQAAAYVQKHYGDVYVDAERGRAFGINGCRVLGIAVDGGGIRLDIEKFLDAEMDATIRLSEGAPTFRVDVNGSRAEELGPGEFRVRL